MVVILFSFSIAYAQKQKSQELTDINLSFVQTAKSGTLKAISDKPGYYTLTLEDVGPYISYLSERPNRIKGIVPTEKFIQTWGVGNNSFAANNPNGVIIPALVDGVTNKSTVFYTITLSSPQFNQKQFTVRYIVKLILSQQFFYKHIHFDHVILLIN